MVRGKTLVNKIFDKQKEIGMTQKELSEKSGISKTEIINIRNGKKEPRLDTLLKLYNVVGLKMHLTNKGE